MKKTFKKNEKKKKLQYMFIFITDKKFNIYIYIQGGPSEVIQSNISKISRDREKCFV